MLWHGTATGREVALLHGRRLHMLYLIDTMVGGGVYKVL